jgi:resolvase-like protein
VTAAHLSRQAVLYVRQSSLKQVIHNTESAIRQYDLRGKAIALGWAADQITVIDTGQGHSGASAADREGFQHLVAEVSLGRAGIVLGLECSRLARNSADWHQLLELCAMTGTLICDEDGLYDPRSFNDRLLPPRSLAKLTADVERAGRLRMEASYVQLGALLPDLIKELTVHVHELTGAEQAQAFRLLAEVYAAVDSMAYKLGYMDLFALAVERMAWAAAQSDDPLLRPVAAMRRSSVFLATGGWDGGITLLAHAGREIDQGQGDNATLSVYGTMHLRSAILAARANRPSSAWDSIGQTSEVSARLLHDTRDYGLLFGPTNVAIHGVAVAVELGDADEAVRRGGNLELPEDLPRERSSHHFIDLSRAWLWQGRPDKALTCVTRAERLAPQRTRYHPMARQTVMQLLDDQRRLPEPLRGVATRMGIS